jgi:hypothetical protein
MDARSHPAGALPCNRAQLDGDAVRKQVSGGLVGRTCPDEAEIAVAGPHRIDGSRFRRRAGTVHVQLLAVGEPVREAPVLDLHELGTEHVAVEGIRAFPVGHGDHDVIDANLDGYSHSMVAGGFDVTSSTTRFTPGISLTMRPEIVSIRSYGSRAQSAVIASSLVTARITIG